MSKIKKLRFIRLIGLIAIATAILIINQYSASKEKANHTRTYQNGIIEVHFINVGQGDSILIEAENSAMLIDAGENNKGTVVVDYLKSHNIKKLDYIIGTHPHSDHIGGLDTVMEAIPVDYVIMPFAEHTTNTYEDVLDTIDAKELSLKEPVVGDVYPIGPASFTILAPNNNSYEDLNNYSIVIKLTYKNTSFLLTGDAEELSEEEMLKNRMDLSADVLKLAHHGSAYSSGNHFIDAVKPTYAVISVGADNEYGHPHTETFQTIKDRNIKLYRTDIQGTVVFTSDGENISVNTAEYTITDDDLVK